MRLQLHESLHSRIPGVTFGMVTISNVTVREHNEQLWRQLEDVCYRRAHEFTVEKLADYQQIAAVRGLQKSFGFDPTRYRPSSEALLRRVLKGQSLYQINTAVDVNNWCSVEFVLPMCVYDLHNVQGQAWVRVGEPDEEYQGIGRQTFQVNNKIIIADDNGIMGSTVSDSERTKVTLETKNILLVIYAPSNIDNATVEEYASLAGQRITAYNGGQTSDIAALTVP